MGDRVTYELVDGIATITMDDGKVNVMSPAMQQELHAAFDRAESDHAIVVLRGRAGFFSAGFDLQVLGAGGEEAIGMVRGGLELAIRLLAFPYPIVIACTGHAIAMGAFLVLTGDYRVGAEGPFKLVANEVSIGLTVPRAAVEILRLRLNASCFHRAVALSEVFTAANAIEAGFLDRVVAADRVAMEAHDVAVSFNGLDLAAHGATKLRAREQALGAMAAGNAADFDGPFAEFVLD